MKTNTLTLQEQKQALENAMASYAFPKKYFVSLSNEKIAKKFTLASEGGSGFTIHHSIPMNYDEFNFYLRGWYDAKIKRF